MGATFAAYHGSRPLSSSPPAFAGGTVALWWILFNIGDGRAERRFQPKRRPRPHRPAAYTYLHLPIVAGIIIVAAALEWVIAHPHGHIAPYVIAGTLGGPALYLAGTAAFKRATGAVRWPLSHLAGIVVLAGLAPVAARLEPWQLALAVATVVLIVALWETLSLGARHRAERLADEGGGG